MAGSGFEDLGRGAFAIDPGRRTDYDDLLKHLRSADGELPERILHLWSVTPDEPSFTEGQTAGLVSLALLAQAIAGAGHSAAPIRLALVGNGLAQVLDGDPVHPAKATLLGAAKVVRQELPRLALSVVDVALPAADDERLVGQLLAEMESAEPDVPVVALRGRQRFVRGFAPVRLPAGAAGLAAEGVYLIAGAADGPGFALASHLLRRSEAKVGLLVPSAFFAAETQLADLEQAAAPDRLLTVRSDDPAAVGSLLADLRARFGPLTGAFWTGGAFPGGLLQLKTPELLQSDLAPLAQGAEALLSAIDSLDTTAAAPPPFVVLSSTTTALTGGVGQLELAAAGSYLEALAAARETAAGPRAVAVHWDPYQWGSWLAAGVAGGMANLSADEVEAGLHRHGVAAERSAAALDRLLAGLPNIPALAVSARDLPELIAEVDGVTAETLLAQLASGHAETVERPALRTAFVPAKDELEERIAAIWQELFGIAPIGRDDSFLELGGHSLLAIQIVTRLRDVLGADLPVTALFEAPTVGQLARAVRQARGESDPEELEALLALVEGLSPEEAAARLEELAEP